MYLKIKTGVQEKQGDLEKSREKKHFSDYIKPCFKKGVIYEEIKIKSSAP
jgi:hypothetical protein